MPLNARCAASRSSAGHGWFAGSDPGGERVAAKYTLIATAKPNGIDPEKLHRSSCCCLIPHIAAVLAGCLLQFGSGYALNFRLWAPSVLDLRQARDAVPLR